jgi:septin family protein
MTTINGHIENYLSYYLESKVNPKFAVLLKGKWGCGKTWFVENFIKDKKKEKFIYISVYGLSSFSEIEDQIFQKLHPVLSSKSFSIAGKILKGVMKTAIKIDLDGDNKADATVKSEVPDINFPDYLKNTSNCIFVIDWLCQNKTVQFARVKLYR